MRFPTLETERLKLVQIGKEYTKSFFEIMSKDEVIKYYGMDKVNSIHEASKIIESFHNTYKCNRGIRWGLITKNKDEFIGTIGLNNLNAWSKKTEVGYELHPDFWNRGLTSEAMKEVLRYSFEELNLFRVGAVTFPDNTASINLLKKIGFMEEGRLRGYLYQNYQSHDALIFSLLKKEWK
ncbi:GNAT family N-acetyltransferase [Aquibacillus rhizosphaerae]|uniref:GNAT family protein n=1 Tax=Aquibacillus rhizosphaerae TaxID=3051431 RepID=A0ABT7LB82_9BACI|nr:GNAT family protein [Aquibacillus sp. LR5S19]MDL4843117.1 GNAT family protein [Aquibacillus sp. LR5S19]